MRHRLGDQRVGLLARAVHAQQRDEGRLAGIGVLADRLAGLFDAAFDIQQVVGDLEGEAESCGIGAQRLSAPPPGRVAEDGAGLAGEARSMRRSSVAAAG